MCGWGIAGDRMDIHTERVHVRSLGRALPPKHCDTGHSAYIYIHNLLNWAPQQFYWWILGLHGSVSVCTDVQYAQTLHPCKHSKTFFRSSCVIKC